MSALNLIFSYFGFWQVIRDKSIAAQHPKSLFSPEAIIPTHFGVMLALVLAERRPLHLWNLPFRRKFGEWNAAVEKEDFSIPFTRLFGKDELQNTLPRKKKGKSPEQYPYFDE